MMRSKTREEGVERAEIAFLALVGIIAQVLIAVGGALAVLVLAFLAACGIVFG